MKYAVLLIALLRFTTHAMAASCPSAVPGLQGLVQAEYAFAEAARTSVRQAFLANLGEDAWVLQPTPIPARAWYQAAPESDARLEWYPHVADVAGSQDLGFSSGPWVYSKDAAHAYGHFLTLWRRGPDCRWRVLFDGGIGHPQQTAAEAALRPEEMSAAPLAPPAASSAGEAAAFQSVAGREGLSAALRTYARNGTFLFLAEGAAPMDLGQAERLNRKRRIKGPWSEATQGQSEDGSLRYMIGRVERGSYVQLWQYDPKVANWGLRILMLTGP